MIAALFFDYVRLAIALMAPVMLVLALSGCADPCSGQNRSSWCKSVG